LDQEVGIRTTGRKKRTGKGSGKELTDSNGNGKVACVPEENEGKRIENGPSKVETQKHRREVAISPRGDLSEKRRRRVTSYGIAMRQGVRRSGDVPAAEGDFGGKNRLRAQLKQVKEGGKKLRTRSENIPVPSLL